jgi:cyclic pyranopterin phosphate synthase
MHALGDADYERTVQLAGTAVLRRTAIEHLVARALDPVADLILKEDTYRDIRPWIHELVGMGIRKFALWLVSLTDHNRNNVSQLPMLSAIAPHVMGAFDDARAGGYEVVALHIPRCLLPGYENHVRHPGDDLVTVVTPDDAFDLADSKLAGGVKPAACAACRWFDHCPGLRPDYIARHGDREPKAV